MNKEGKQSPIAIIVEGIFALFLAFIFFGIVFPSLNEVTGNVFPGFGIILVGSFIIIILAIIASIVSAFGGGRR